MPSQRLLINTHCFPCNNLIPTETIMKTAYLVLVALLALASSGAFAYDPSPLQAICVATNNTNNGVFVNGKFCKDPKLATPDDFFLHGLFPSGPFDPLGYQETEADVNAIPGLNTLGVSLSRIDYAPHGLNPLHYHPRGTEILVVLEGTLQVGFVTEEPDYTFFPKVLQKGDVFVFPIGHIHFQWNIGDTNAVAISGFGSQNPGHIALRNAVFGSNPRIPPEVIAKAFKLDQKQVEYLEKQF